MDDYTVKTKKVPGQKKEKFTLNPSEKILILTRLRMIRKIQKVLQAFLNLNLAILKMRIAERIKDIYI